MLSKFIVRDVRPCGGVPAELCVKGPVRGGVPAELCVKGPVRGGVPAELCVKGLVPEILAETFFVDISWWFPRLDLPTGENSRVRRRLLESARVAPLLPIAKKISFFGAVIFEIHRVLKQFSAKNFENEGPKNATDVCQIHGVWVRRARIRVAAVCPSNFPPSAGPGAESTRDIDEKRFAQNFGERNLGEGWGEGGWGGEGGGGEGRTGRDGVDVRQDRAAGFCRERKFRKTYLLSSCILVHAERPLKSFYEYVFLFVYIYIYIFL